MYVTFEKSAALDQELQHLVVQRARHAMRGISLAVEQVNVHLSRSLGLSLSSEKRCWVQLTVGGSGIVIGVAQAADWRAAIDKALARAVRTVPEVQRRFRRSARRAMEATRGRRPYGIAVAAARWSLR